MKATNRILVFRFSAMGDVAMSAAVLRELCQQQPDIQIIMVSRPLFEPFFENIKNIHFHPLDTVRNHKGMRGLFKLFRELQAYQPTAIADLHHNLRSTILTGYFRFTNIPIVRMDKHRSKKKALTRKKNKRVKPLRSILQCYADVFRKLGFSINLKEQRIPQRKPLPSSYQFLSKEKMKSIIGISPFAQHKQKVYPLAKMEAVIENLNQSGFQLLIFGGGKEERLVAEEWEKRFLNVTSLIGKTSLKEELAIISHLDLMLSMDSAGMHLASLMGVRVISIWGSTHPYNGFLGYGQQEKDSIQLDLFCRPCSVYGNKPCYRGDFACMQGLDPGIIIARVNESQQR